MFTLRHKLPIWILGLLVIFGTIVEWFFWDPIHGKALVPTILHGGTGNITVGVLGIIGLGIPIIIGWLILMFGKDRLRVRLHWLWTPLGLLIAVWGWLTVCLSDYPEFRFTWNQLLATTPELYRSTAFGLLIAFYSLESARPLWNFYYIWAWAGIVMYGAEIPKLFGLSGVPWSTYFEGKDFWHKWGFTLLDAYSVPLSFIAWYYIIRGRKQALEQEGERHALLSGILEGLGLPVVLLLRALHIRTLRQRIRKSGKTPKE